MNETTKRPGPVDSSNKTNDESLSYIIQRNSDLEQKLSDALVRIAKLESQNDQLEDESDKHEQSMTYMKGVTKNVVGLKDIFENIRENSKKSHSFYKKIIEEKEKHFRMCITHISYVILTCMLICFYLLTSQSFMMATTLSMILFTPTFFFYKEYRKYSVIYDTIIKSNYSAVESHNNKIREKENAARELKSATDYLSEHIDNI
jgi:cation transport ATPase